MNYNVSRQLESVKQEDLIWYIYYFIVFAALASNKYEKEYLVTQNKSTKEKYHSINLVIFTIAFLIYIYFVIKNLENYKNKKDSKSLLNLISSILFLVGGGILLFTELTNIDDNIELGF